MGRISSLLVRVICFPYLSPSETKITKTKVQLLSTASSTPFWAWSTRFWDILGSNKVPANLRRHPSKNLSRFNWGNAPEMSTWSRVNAWASTLLPRVNSLLRNSSFYIHEIIDSAPLNISTISIFRKKKREGEKEQVWGRNLWKHYF